MKADGAIAATKGGCTDTVSATLGANGVVGTGCTRVGLEPTELKADGATMATEGECTDTMQW